MKKMRWNKLALLLTLVLILCGCVACGDDAEKTPEQNVTQEQEQPQKEEVKNDPVKEQAEDVTTEPEKEEVSGWYFEGNGVKLVPGMDAGGLKDLLGEPNFFFEAESCAFEGMDRIYTYNGFEVYTADPGDAETISSILMIDDSVKTPEGLRLGDSVDKMVSLYGDSYEQNFETYFYYQDNLILIFVFEDGVLVSVEYGLAQ